MVSYRCTNPAKFRANTPETMAEMADSLVRMQATATEAQLRRQEQILGIPYIPEAIFYNEHARSVARLPWRRASWPTA